MNFEREEKPAEKDAPRQTFLFADFVFEAGENLLWRGAEIVGLPPKTCELLAVFIRHAGRLLTKEELMNRIWADTFVEEANLSHHIAVLRKSLGEDKNGRRFIETVPRKGYRFVAPVTPKNRIEVVVTEMIETRVVEEEIDAPDNPLIGREKDIAVVKNLLRRPDTRILTLTGVGGAGKTSLARIVLQEISREFPGGVWFVDLSSINDASLVPATIAQSLKIPTATDEDPSEVVGKHLREREMLLVLDNFEQVTGASPDLARMASSKSKILVTSRTRLHLRIEREFQVPPLVLPQKERLPEELIECSAIRLFVERANRIKADFELTDENACAVAEICRRLEGLPLAIELAAARVRLLSPEALLERLQNQLKLLTGGPKDLPARQQTMRAAIEWSYDLLGENEKRVFAALAIFAGGFTLEAAESILEQAGFEAFDAIESLVDKNMLRQIETQSGGRRLRMLEAVREFALERFGAGEDAHGIRQIHADYFLVYAEKMNSRRRAAGDWAEGLKLEHDNLRAALSWLIENDAEKSLRLAYVLSIFWSSVNHFREGRLRLGKALRKKPAPPSAARVLATNGAAMLAWKQGDYRAARSLYEESLRIGETLNDGHLIATAKNGFGIVSYLENDNRAAKIFFEEALRLSRDCEDHILTNSILAGLGEIARLDEDFPAVRRYNAEVAEYASRIGDKNLLSGSLINLGAAAFLENDLEDARSLYTKALSVIGVDLKQFVALCLDGFAALAAEKGDLKRAALLAGAAENLCREIDYEPETPDRVFREKYLGKLREGLDPASLADLVETGRGLDAEEAVRLALED